MPLYMDLHILPGVKARDVAEAHRRDLLIQEDHRCNCMTYWIDEKRGNVFCLIEAPAQEAVTEMHQRAHGLIPHKIIEVNTLLVESFLGRISDPEEAETSTDGLKIFSDTSFRTLLVIQMHDPVLLQYRLGREKANELLSRQHDIIRKELETFGGHEVEHEGNKLIASFISAGKAFSCALAIRDKISHTERQASEIRMGIHAGDPVAKNEKLFGDTIQLAARMCVISKDSQITLSSAVKELVSKDQRPYEEKNIFILSPHDEHLLGLLFNGLEENWQDPEFNVADYGHVMAMSQSQLYRKTIALTGLSPNVLLKEFRLEKARELMKKLPYNISQITFDSGFTSPSYFTKCFKKEYGLLPGAYLDMLS